MLLGLASVTLEHLTVDNILDIAAKNGLMALEWSESHVQRGHIAEAERLRKLTEEQGMRTTSYSTFFDVMADRPETFNSVLETAEALGTDTVVLAIGRKSDGNATEEAWAALTDGSRRLSRLAAQQGIRLCFAYRRGCYLEDYMRVAQFIETVGDNAFICWEPNRTTSLIYNIFELKMLVPFVYQVYVSSPDAPTRYTPIIEGKDEWQQYLKVLKSKENGVLLFKGCDVADFDSECALMRKWVHDAYSAVG